MQGAAFVLTFASLALSCASSMNRPLLNAYVIGAVDSKVHQFHYQADIQFKGRHVCSGAVIGKYDLLTAAHCIPGPNHNELKVIVGNGISHSNRSIHEVAMFQLHPLFERDTLEYDVAIIKVKKPFRVQSAWIPQPGDELLPGRHALVSSRTLQSEDESHLIKYVEVTLTSHEECDQYYSNHGGITRNMVCAGTGSNSIVPNSCLADPGAPLVADGKLYGIASWGDACNADAANNVVYTDVTKLHYFLRRNTFIYENAESTLCAAVELVVSLLPTIPIVPAWMVTLFNLLLKLLGC